jgi:hypothetical protein
MRDPIFKCAICGQFMAYKEFLAKEIEHVFTADNYFYNEEDYFQHKKCANRREKEEEKLEAEAWTPDEQL